MFVGAQYNDNKCTFNVWAPYHDKVSLYLTDENERLSMNRCENGYWSIKLNAVKPKTEYLFTLGDKLATPDPASQFQPKGVFGPSATVDHGKFAWNDVSWQGIPIQNMVIYELHVGTFTAEGTFQGVLKRVKELADIGINSIELMPIAQFSGARNWGYDGVFPYAVQNSYGGPEELKKLVDFCHVNGISVILDVVYNHVGSEGNCLTAFGPYFLKNRSTPWGPAINFDNTDSLHVRRFFIENALHWFKNYHIDALRLDAVHAIIDTSPMHVIKELVDVVARYSKRNRKTYLIAESLQNDPGLIGQRRAGGVGVDGLWLDDFHHALHALVTGERASYYIDFGRLSDIVKALNEGFVYSGQSSRFFGMSRGKSSKGISPSRFVVFSQNHDQTGNRPQGERLISLAGLEAAKLAAGLVVISPYVPLFFMGEEYGENAPFLYFTSFEDSILAQNVRKGRKKEHKGRGRTEIPDPQSEATFMKSKINWGKRQSEQGKKILDYYRKLLALKKSTLACRNKHSKRLKTQSMETERVLLMKNVWFDPKMLALANFSCCQTKFVFPFDGRYEKILDSADSEWNGQGSLLRDSISHGEQVMQRFSIAIFHSISW